ncbi:hypothetical protein N0V85_007559 [Neurospora sp. IMI 360204]|nr:hypothetical protein N0V85_007559 [Neurospora sp. IMI 360204]
MFTYSSLSREKRESRFFRFRPACQSGSDLISLQLRHASLDDDTLKYCALSYVWGHSKDQVEVEINGKGFSVGENLHAFLQMLHYHGFDFWFWADAISIQQSDDEEKSWHVQRMCDVYKKAECVYSWLGPSSKETDVAMDFFDDWGFRAREIGLMEKLWPIMESTRTDQRALHRIISMDFEQGIERFFLPKPVFERTGAMDDARLKKSAWTAREAWTTRLE